MKNILLFKNRTTYSEKNYNEFVKFHNKKYGFTYDLYTIGILILFIYCLIINTINKVIFLFIVFIILTIVFLAYRVFYPLFEYKKEVASTSISKEQTFYFYFYEKSFKIREKTRFTKIKYFKIYKVFETKNFFYLYMTKKNAFLIDKQGFSLGNSEEFSKFLKNKFKFKYNLEIEH